MSRTVCLTGASGFLGTHVLKLLLEQGYTIHATTTSIERHGARLNGLVPQATAEGRLKLFEADLLDAKSFDAPMSQCTAVLHTASPFYFGETHDELVLPAVNGTEAVLTAAKAHNITDVVLTSSTAAVYCTMGAKPNEHVYTEADWSDVKVLTDHKMWYPLSKTRAEIRANELAAELGLNLAVMCPTLIWGPMLQSNLNTSSKVILSFADGTKTQVPNGTKCVVDVRDVAAAHVAALENIQVTKGRRFLLIGCCPHFSEVADAVRAALPASLQANVPTEASSEIVPNNFGAQTPHPTLFDCSSATTDLGITFRSLQDMVNGTVQSLVQLNFLSE
jgi:nucleoside-diphosphate-sugar epimerase